jgi:hypothetical protein
MNKPIIRGAKLLLSPVWLAFFLCGLPVTAVQASLLYNSDVNSSQMATVLGGLGLTLSNLAITKGLAQQYGIFSGGKSVFGVESGIFMNTGNLGSLQGPNTTAAYSYSTKTSYLDPDLASISKSAKYDPAIIEFDIVPQGDRLNFVFSFGSEEYPEYVCSQFNDAFGLFVSGPGISGVQNAAFLPKSNIPIAVNNVNAGVPGIYANGAACQLGNAAYFVDNGNGSGSAISQLDGYTKLITSSLGGLIPGQSYHVKLAMADAGDSSYDSGAFFKWLTSTYSEPVDLSLQAGVNKPSPSYGREVEVIYTVSNASAIDARLTQVGLDWPAGMTWVGDDSGGAYNPATGEWNADVIPAHGEKSLKVRAQVGNAASYTVNGEIIFAFNEDPDSTPLNRAINPGEDDTASVTLTPVAPKPPVIGNGNAIAYVTVPENETAVTTIKATSGNGEPVTYALSGGADADKFHIDPNTGVLTFIAAPDYEAPQDADKNNLYEVGIIANSDGLSATQSVLVSVTNVVENLPPTITYPGSVVYNENSKDIVLDINATDDQDTEGNGLVYALTGGVDNALFKLNSVTGKLSFKHPPDYEQPRDKNKDNAYIVSFSVCDHTSACVEQVLIVTVQDVDEDTDGDGLMDSVEKKLGTNPDKVDTDGDGLSDFDEVGSLAKPLDSDKDGVINALDSDDDNDGILTRYEAADPDGNGNPADARDSDGDGVPDYLDTDDDGDGVLTRYEAADPDGNGNPADARDSDGDGLPDYLDSDDDGDGTPTKGEKPDANGDGNPADAFDGNGNGIPAYLDPTEDSGVNIQVRAFLQGPFQSSTRLMRGDLYTLKLMPLMQPYGSLKTAFGYADSGETVSPFDYFGTETASATVLALGAGDAPVDWVLIELRDKLDPRKKIGAAAGLLQRDGDVVDAVTGSTTLRIPNVDTGSYYVVVRHRCHLAVMTAEPAALSMVATAVDFTLPATKTYGGDAARLQSTGIALMWSGDANNSNTAIANGPGSDANVILGAILVAPANNGVNVAFKLDGYYASDLNMDGSTVYTGPGNDLNLLLGNVLLHPGNTSTSSNYVIQGAVPH